MLDKLRLLNPFTPIVTPDDASAAARAGAVGAFGTVLTSILGAVQLYLLRDRLLAVARESAAAQTTDPEMARQTTAIMEGVVTFLPIATSAVTIAIYLVFGFVQWRRRTMMIPLIMFLLCAYGVVAGLANLLTQGAHVRAMMLGVPIWWQAVTWLLALVILALFWAGVRGGSRLKKIGAAPDVSTF
jgi:hypothetical protein